MLGASRVLERRMVSRNVAGAEDSSASFWPHSRLPTTRAGIQSSGGPMREMASRNAWREGLGGTLNRQRARATTGGEGHRQSLVLVIGCLTSLFCLSADYPPHNRQVGPAHGELQRSRASMIKSSRGSSLQRSGGGPGGVKPSSEITSAVRRQSAGTIRGSSRFA